MSKKITDQITWNKNNNIQLHDKTVTVYSNKRTEGETNPVDFI